MLVAVLAACGADELESLVELAAGYTGGEAPPLVEVRAYRGPRAADACCAERETPALRRCLRAAAASCAAAGRAGAPARLEVAVVTSTALAEAYAAHAEAALAHWAARARVELTALEVNDTARAARAPHWWKVALGGAMLERRGGGGAAPRAEWLLVLDADAVVTDARAGAARLAWLDAALAAAGGAADAIVAREGEGPAELAWTDADGRRRLNDAEYVNTGVLLLRRGARARALLREWWAVGDAHEVYRDGRTYDQGALGRWLFDESRAAPSPQPRPVVAVIEPELLNNHPPGGSFARAASAPASRLSVDAWWCEHFRHPILQLAGQDDAVRARVLSRVREALCADHDPHCLHWPRTAESNES